VLPIVHRWTKIMRSWAIWGWKARPLEEFLAISGLKLIVDHMGVPRASKGEAAYRFQPELLALAKLLERGGQSAGLRRGRIPLPQLASAPAPLFRRVRSRADVLGHRD
jgi:hypothetical protein